MSTTELDSGRSNQKQRTRQALVQAARDLLDNGRNPTFDEVAEAAMVSRATAYRYFSSIEALVAECAIEQSWSAPDTVIGDRRELLDRVLAAVSGATMLLLDNEVTIHVVAKSMADQWLNAAEGDAPPRPARRLELIDAALAPYAKDLGPAVTQRLRSALALVCGLEAVLSARDVVNLDRDEAVATFAWAAKALVEAAQNEAASTARGRPRRRTTS